MATLASLMVTIGANTSGFRKGVQNSNKSLQQLEQRMDNTKRLAKTLAVGVVAVGAAASGVGFKAVQLAAKMEQTEVAFTTLLGSGQKAEKMLKELQDFSATTPFQFPGLADSARLLITMGFNAEQAVPAMRTVADAVAAAGGGQAELLGVSRALGQIQAKGKVSAEELMQLAERGIPAQKILQAELGLTGEQVADIGNQGITATEGIEALLRGLSEKFDGAADDQARTVSGMWSTVKDNVTLTLIPLGKIIIDTFNLKPAMQNAIGWLTELRVELVSIKNTIERGGVKAAIDQFIPNNMQATIVGVTGAVAGLATAILITLLPALMATAAAWWATLAPMLPYIAVGTAIALVVFTIYKNWKNFGDFMSGIWGVAASAAESANIKIQTGWNKTKQVVYSVIKSILDAVAPLLDWLPGRLGDSFETMRNAVNSKLQDVGNNLDDLSERGKQNQERMAQSLNSLGDSWDSLKKGIVNSVSGVTKTFSDAAGGANAFADAMNNVGQTAQDITPDLEGVGSAAAAAAKAQQSQVPILDMLDFKLNRLDTRWQKYKLTTDTVKDSVEWLAQKNEYLQQKMNLVSERTTILRQKLKDADVATNGWTDQSMQLAEQLDRVSLKELELKNSIRRYNQSLNGTRQWFKQLAEVSNGNR